MNKNKVSSILEQASDDRAVAKKMLIDWTGDSISDGPNAIAERITQSLAEKGMPINYAAETAEDVRRHMTGVINALTDAHTELALLAASLEAVQACARSSTQKAGPPIDLA